MYNLPASPKSRKSHSPLHQGRIWFLHFHLILFFKKSLTIFFSKLKRHNAQRSWDRGRQKCPKNKIAQGEMSTKWDSHKHWRRLYNSQFRRNNHPLHLLRSFSMQVLQNQKNKLEVLYTKDRAMWCKDLIFSISHNNSEVGTFQFYKWGNWYSKCLSNLSNGHNQWLGNWLKPTLRIFAPPICKHLRN